MKKTLSAISALAVMIGLSTSCQKELTGGQEPAGNKPFTITASIADSGTKVSYAEDGDNNLTPSWQVGDVIIGFDGDGNTYGYSVTEVNTETKKATLEIIESGDNAGGKTVNPANDTKMYMFYAPGKKPTDIGTKSLTVSLASQDKDVVPALMMSSATVTNSSLSLVFENKTAIIGVKTPTMTTASKQYTSLALSGSVGLNTAVKFDLNGETLQASYQTAGTITKTLDFTSNASTKQGPDVIYIVACPLESAADLTFTFNGNEEYFKVAGATMEAGHYYYMTPTTGKQKFAITVQDGITGGTISTSPSGNVAWDTEVTVTATPNTGYELTPNSITVKKDGGDNVFVSTDNKFTMPQSNVTVSGSFQKKNFTITATGTGSGTYAVTGGTYTIKKGTDDVTTAQMDEVIIVTPDPAVGYSGGTVTVTETTSGNNVAVTGNTFTMPAADVTITVSFNHDEYDIAGNVSPSSDAGTVTFKKFGSEDGITQAYYNDVITVEATPAIGYVLVSITLTPEGGSGTDITLTKTFTMPAKNVTVTVTFEEPLTGTINDHNYVKIGGKKWATTNIGASNPQDYGKYFQWGEIAGHECNGTYNFNWASAPFNNNKSNYSESYFTTYKGKWITNDVLNSDYDAANANWGSPWRMPTKDDFAALANACRKEGYTSGNFIPTGTKASFAAVNDKGVYWITNYSDTDGKTGLVFCDGTNKLFFPAAGSVNSTSLSFASTLGYYWSSTLGSPYLYHACSLYFFNNQVNPQFDHYRYLGLPVRPLSD